MSRKLNLKQSIKAQTSTLYGMWPLTQQPIMPVPLLVVIIVSCEGADVKLPVFEYRLDYQLLAKYSSYLVFLIAKDSLF